MKKIILLAMMVVMGLQSQAQIVSSRTSMTTTTKVASEPRSGWQTFGLEYIPSKFDFNKESESFSTLSLLWTKATSVSSQMPLFIEYGIGGQYSWWSKDDYEIKYVSVKVPINLVYDFQIPESNITLDPFIGIKFRGNIWGELKAPSYSYGSYTKKTTETYDLFDKDEGDWKRFQIGWNIGLKARFNNSFYVGLSYGSDFNDIAEDTKIKETTLSVGLVF